MPVYHPDFCRSKQSDGNFIAGNIMEQNDKNNSVPVNCDKSFFFLSSFSSLIRNYFIPKWIGWRLNVERKILEKQDKKSIQISFSPGN